MNPIVVPVRNCLSYTRNAVGTFRKQDVEGGVSILILDNASTDGTGPWLNSQHDLLRARFSPPKSVAASWNLGLEWFFTRKAEHVLVVNNDVLLRPDTYRELLAANLPFATGVGVSTVEQMNETFVRSDRCRPDFACYLIRREAWKQLGPFNESYAGAFYEDNAFHVKAWRRGVHLTCIGIPFWHAASATLKNADEQMAKEINEKAERNKERFKEQFGCYTRTPEYDALFAPEKFGINAQVVRGEQQAEVRE